MFRKLRHRLRSPASVTAAVIVTLVVAVGGFAAIAKNKDEVTLRTVTGGPTQSGDPFEEIDIPLTNASFTQRAGEAMLVIVRADFTPSPSTHFCTIQAVVTDANDDGAIGIFFEEDAEKGDVGQATGAELLAAPAVDTQRTLRAVLVEDPFSDEPRCDGPDEDDHVVREDTWTVSLRVTVTTLRS